MRNFLFLTLSLLLFTGCESTDFTESRPTSDSKTSSSSLARSAHSAPLLRADSQLSFDYTVTSDWGSGFGAQIVLKNTGLTTVEGWTLEFDFPYHIDSLWNAAVVEQAAGHYQLTPLSWNREIGPGQSITIGFNGSPGNATLEPTGVVLHGESSEPPTPSPTPSTSPSPTPTTPAPEPTATPEQPLSIIYNTTGDWGSGFGGEVIIRNESDVPIDNWVLEFELEARITSIWNVSIASNSGSTFRVVPAEWQKTIAPNSSVSFGFNGAPGNLLQGAHHFKLSSDSGPSPLPDPSPVPTPNPSPDKGLKVVGYFPEWGIYERNYNVSDIPADKLSAVIYAFADISAEGKVTLFDSWAAVDKPFPGDTWDQALKGNFHQLQLLKQAHPDLDILIAIGGWTLSGRFSDVALTPSSRERFASSVVDFVTQYGFDGVDLDWEYPVAGGLSSNTYRAQDKQNYTLLARELRRQLDLLGQSQQKHYLLTAALPVGYDKIQNLELAPLAEQLDWINLMTYDYHGSWESTTDHQAPLHANPASASDSRLNTEWSVKAYLASGVPPNKILLGIPAYGLSWKGTTGLFAPANGVPQGTWDGTGVFDYKDIMNRLRQQPDIYKLNWDSVSRAPWIFAQSLSGGVLITFESLQSLNDKMDFVQSYGLGGTMLWELSSDLPVKDAESLILRMAR